MNEISPKIILLEGSKSISLAMAQYLKALRNEIKLTNLDQQLVKILIEREPKNFEDETSKICFFHSVFTGGETLI